MRASNTTRSVSWVATLFWLATPAPQDAPRGDFEVEVVKQDLDIDVELAGVFVAEDKDEIRMEPKAYRGELIVTKLLSEGTAVKEGDVLMEFDVATLEESLEEARNEVEDKQVELAKASADLEAFRIEREADLARLEKELEMAGRDFEKVQEEAELESEAKGKSISDAERRLADARVDFEQLTQLYEERELHTATENILIERERHQIEELEKSLAKTKREVHIWNKYERMKPTEEQQLEVAKKSAELRKTRVQFEGDRKEKTAAVKKAERELKKAERKVGEYEADAASLAVVSPRDGILFYGTIGGDSPNDIVIMSFNGMNDEMRIGGRVRTHQVLLTVASMENLSVRMQVLENDIQHMRAGLPATIRPDAFPGLSVSGEVTEVDQVASRTGYLSELREFTVRAKYEGVFPQLRSGMNCRVTVHADSVPDAVQVPVLAVFAEGGDYHCLVKDGGATKRRPVKLGATNGSMVEISEGLRPSEVVTLHNPEVE